MFLTHRRPALMYHYEVKALSLPFKPGFHNLYDGVQSPGKMKADRRSSPTSGLALFLLAFIAP